METFSALIILSKGGGGGGGSADHRWIPLKKGPTMLTFDILFHISLNIKQTLELPVIWDALILISM